MITLFFTDITGKDNHFQAGGLLETTMNKLY